MSTEKLMEIYQLLYERYGCQHWWPGHSRFEIIVGAILTQNTNWGNVEKAIKNLKAAKSLTAERLQEMDISSLAEMIRPAGYYNIKASRLKNFLEWLFKEHDGDLNRLEDTDPETLRQAFLQIKGVGPETADSILLYAAQRPVFVVDAYTRRILLRHGRITESAGYDDIAKLMTDNLPCDVQLYNEYHALIVRLCKENCKAKPVCATCPLRDWSIGALE